MALCEIQTIWQANKFAYIPLGTLKRNSLQPECNVCVCGATECGIAAHRHWTWREKKRGFARMSNGCSMGIRLSH